KSSSSPLRCYVGKPWCKEGKRRTAWDRRDTALDADAGGVPPRARRREGRNWLHQPERGPPLQKPLQNPIEWSGQMNQPWRAFRLDYSPLRESDSSIQSAKCAALSAQIARQQARSYCLDRDPNHWNRRLPTARLYKEIPDRTG